MCSDTECGRWEPITNPAPQAGRVHTVPPSGGTSSHVCTSGCSQDPGRAAIPEKVQLDVEVRVGGSSEQGQERWKGARPSRAPYLSIHCWYLPSASTHSGAMWTTRATGASAFPWYLGGRRGGALLCKMIHIHDMHKWRLCSQGGAPRGSRTPAASRGA